MQIRSLSTAPSARASAPRFDARATLDSALQRVFSARTKPEAEKALLDGIAQMGPLAKQSAPDYVKSRSLLYSSFEAKMRSMDSFEHITRHIGA